MLHYSAFVCARSLQVMRFMCSIGWSSTEVSSIGHLFRPHSTNSLLQPRAIPVTENLENLLSLHYLQFSAGTIYS